MDVSEGLSSSLQRAAQTEDLCQVAQTEISAEKNEEVSDRDPFVLRGKLGPHPNVATQER
jgi:hypothetical protein